MNFVTSFLGDVFNGVSKQKKFLFCMIQVGDVVN